LESRRLTENSHPISSGVQELSRRSSHKFEELTRGGTVDRGTRRWPPLRPHSTQLILFGQFTHHILLCIHDRSNKPQHSTRQRSNLAQRHPTMEAILLRQALQPAAASSTTAAMAAATTYVAPPGYALVECATGNNFDGRIGLRISAIFVILVGSLLGEWIRPRRH
jgi:hypothetical protein